jgi:hypothetical protein
LDNAITAFRVNFDPNATVVAVYEPLYYDKFDVDLGIVRVFTGGVPFSKIVTGEGPIPNCGESLWNMEYGIENGNGYVRWTLVGDVIPPGPPGLTTVTDSFAIEFAEGTLIGLNPDPAIVWGIDDVVTSEGTVPSAIASPDCPDDDNDGFVVCNDCTIPEGKFCGDCNDDDASIRPNVREICDRIDNNCDGNTDEDLDETCQACINSDPPDKDLDGDGICDEDDNCPNKPNEDQTDTDGDTVGDACDNCIKIQNLNQADGDEDGRGNACDQETLTVATCQTEPCDPPTCQPGGPCWITATITFGQPTVTICPNKYNIFPGLRDAQGNIISPVYLYTVFGIFKDVCFFDGGESYTVPFDLGERYPNLSAGSQNVTATYVQSIKDDVWCYPADTVNCPDANACDPCLGLFEGSLTAATSTGITIGGDPVERIDATCSCEPSVWAPFAGPQVTCQISNLPQDKDVDGTSIRLNGTVEPTSYSANGTLEVEFDPVEAAKSLGTPYPKEHLPEIQGSFLNEPFYFSAICPVQAMNKANLTVYVDVKQIGSNATHPPITDSTPEGVNVRIYSADSCGLPMTWPNYSAIYEDTCDYVVEGLTDGEGKVEFFLPYGSNYFAIGKMGDSYGGASVGAIDPTTFKKKKIHFMLKDSKLKPAKGRKFSGSELWIIEPEYIEWDGTQEQYPFVFESVGDWSVTSEVSPPEGFVASEESLSADVNTDLKAVQFTVTDVGSDWVKTKTKHKIKHKGKTMKMDSEIGIKCGKKLQKKKGFDEFCNKVKDKAGK